MSRKAKKSRPVWLNTPSRMTPWYDEAIFYHIYPLGLTGAPRENSYTEPVHRLNTLIPWSP